MLEILVIKDVIALFARKGECHAKRSGEKRISLPRTVPFDHGDNESESIFNAD
jgi:hypothetical protein